MHTATALTTAPKTDRRMILSTLWVFAMFNYIYADVFTTFDILADPEALKKFATGDYGAVPVTPGTLFGAAVLMETAIAMVLLSRILKYRANRWANIIVGVIHTLAVVLSLFVGGIPTHITYYTFFAAIEIACTCVIVSLAWTWPNIEVSR